MLWGKPDGYSFSSGVDETPSKDGSEAAEPEAIIGVKMKSLYQQHVMMTCWYAFDFLAIYPRMKNTTGFPLKLPETLFFRVFINHVESDLADYILKRTKE